MISMILGCFFVPIMTLYTQSKIANKYVEVRDCIAIVKHVAVPIILVSFFGMLIFLLGFMFFIIPGFYLAVKLLPAGPLVVFENLGLIQAFKRSFELTSGYFWKLLLFFIMLAAILSPFFILNMHLTDEVNALEQSQLTYTLFSVGFSVLLNLLQVITIYAVYQLLEIKEGTPPEAITPVFEQYMQN